MPNLTKYSLDHEVRSSFEMGQLIPFLCQEVVPGDKYRVQSSTLVRLQPMLSPLMHRLDYFQRYYYVPYRLLIPNYEQLLTDPDSQLVVPAMSMYLQYVSKTMDELFLEKPLLEYFGLSTSNGDVNPSGVLKDLNATPLLAYYLIYNHYYMRSDLDSRYVDQLRPENFTSAEIRKYIGNVMHVNEGLDYFTSAHTSTQYGNMVQLDMDGNNTITVPEMRLAERLQSFRERLLRVGGKYVNYIKEFFGVEPLDARVQIPKYLGGDSYVLNVSDVDQTAPSELGAVGESYGKSVSVNRTGQIQYDVYEHGLIIGLHFVRPRPSNIGGCPKLFTRRTYFDFFNPHFSALGYQEIEDRELDVARSKDTAFGYVPRYDEYRYGNDIVSGDFRRSLNYWHLSRDISEEKLSVDFVTCRPDNRIFSFVGEENYKLYALSLDNVADSCEISCFVWAPKGAFKMEDSVNVVCNILQTDGSFKLRFDNRFFKVYGLTDIDSFGLAFGFHNQGKVFVRKPIASDYTDDDIQFIPLSSSSSISFQSGSKEYSLNDFSYVSVKHDGVIVGSYPALIYNVDYRGHDETMRLAYKDLNVYGDFIDGVVPYSFSDKSLVNNHVLSVTYNNVDVLRPLARYDGNVLR